MRRGRKANPNRKVRGELQFPPSSAEAPSWFSGHALNHWNALAPMLIETGRLTQGDRSAFEQMCLDFSIIQESREQGPVERVVRHARKTIVRTDANEAHEARKRYARWLIEFGLTPQSRPRLGKPTQPSEDKLGEFLALRT
jgi:P27 family predicted phage terminase small subunit